MKNIITNVVAIGSVIITATNTYLQSIGTGDIDYKQMVFGLAFAVVSYLIGKKQDLSGNHE